MTLSKKNLDKIKYHSLKEKDKEVCGFIINRNGGLDIYKCKNISPTPKKHFIISYQETKLASKYGEILGFYHSHKNNEQFSDNEKFIADYYKLPCFLYVLEKDKFLVYEPSNKQ